MSSFMVLRASSSRRPLAYIPNVDHASKTGRPPWPDRALSRPSLFLEPLSSRRHLHSSSPTHADESAFDKRMQEYRKGSQEATAEKRRRNDLMQHRAGIDQHLLNPLTYAPFQWKWFPYDPRMWGNVRRHWKHRRFRNFLSIIQGSLIEEHGFLKPPAWLTDIPAPTPIFGRNADKAAKYKDLVANAKLSVQGRARWFWTWFLHQSWKYLNPKRIFLTPRLWWTRIREDRLLWRVNQQLPLGQEVSRAAAFPHKRYAEELESVNKLWQSFNVALARRRIKAINKNSLGPAYRNAHVLMSANRIVDWESVKEYTPPRFLWIRMGTTEQTTDGKPHRAVIQMCVQFDTEQRTTFVDPETPVQEAQSYPRRRGEANDSWRINQYRQDLTQDRYNRDLASKSQVSSLVLFPEGKEITSLDAVKDYPRRTTSSRVIDNVIFTFDSKDQLLASDKPNWKVWNRIEVTEPHYLMDPEKWEKLQQKVARKEAVLGSTGGEQVHHVKENKWVEQRRTKEKEREKKEKAGLRVPKEEDEDDTDPIKAMEEQVGRRLAAWRRVSEQEKRERALLAMKAEPERRKDYLHRQVIARAQGKDLFKHVTKEDKVVKEPKKDEAADTRKRSNSRAFLEFFGLTIVADMLFGAVI